MPDGVIRYPRDRFPPTIISHAVWLYDRFTLSVRDVEDLLAPRGITVSYETLRHSCQTFGLAYARRLHRPRGPVGDTWLWTRCSCRSRAGVSICGVQWIKTPLVIQIHSA